MGSGSSSVDTKETAVREHIQSGGISKMKYETDYFQGSCKVDKTGIWITKKIPIYNDDPGFLEKLIDAAGDFELGIAAGDSKIGQCIIQIEEQGSLKCTLVIMGFTDESEKAVEIALVTLNGQFEIQFPYRIKVMQRTKSSKKENTQTIYEEKEKLPFKQNELNDMVRGILEIGFQACPGLSAESKQQLMEKAEFDAIKN